MVTIWTLALTIKAWIARCLDYRVRQLYEVVVQQQKAITMTVTYE